MQSNTVERFRLLVVNEDKDILKELSRCFLSKASTFYSEFKIDIDTVLNPQQALILLARAKKEGRPYALALVDIGQSPEWKGIHLINQLWELDSDLQVMVLSKSLTHPIEKVIETLKLENNFLLAQKPFDQISFRQKITVLIKKWHLTKETRESTQALMQHLHKNQKYERKNNELQFQKEQKLTEAISQNELELYYQPQFNTTTKRFEGVEALLRWNHPVQGMLTPDAFIALAEETGLIVPIGEWVIRTACRQIKMLQEMGFSPIRVGVNVSHRQFTQGNLVELIQTILNDLKLDAKYLELELTENIIISHFEVIDKITQIKALGVKIALDDFGTGYSSLSYLKKIPLDRIKIDRSYIENIYMSSDDEVIIKAIIAMASSLNLSVLAEGVETKKQLKFLKHFDCSEIQGYYFSKPLSFEGLVNFLKKSDKMQH